MTEIERIRKYVKDTKIPDDLSDWYCIDVSELTALYKDSRKDVYASIMLAFEYGKAKGYRAARRRAQHD